MPTLNGRQFKLYEESHGPRQVFFDIVVKLVHGINNVDQTFNATININYMWMLSESEFKAYEKDPESSKSWWTPPAPEMPSAMEVEVSPTPVVVAKLGDMVTGKCTHRVKGTFLEVMELENFPFDCQEFTTSFIFPEAETTFQLHPTLTTPACASMSQPEHIVPEYRFWNPILELASQVCEEIQPDFEYKEVLYPVITLRLKASRVSKGYINKTVITLALVSLATNFAFMMPYDDIGSRLSHVTTLLLTATAFQSAISGLLPAIDYLTLLDKYIILVNLYMMAVMSAMCLMEYLHTHDFSDEEVELADKLTMGASVLLWVAVHAALCCMAYVAHYWYEAPKLNCAEGFGQDKSPFSERCSDSRFGAISPDTGSRIYFGNPIHFETVTGRGFGDVVTAWAGLWWSDTAFGEYGKEYVLLLPFLDEAGNAQLMARKVTGDRNVPGGCVTWQTTNGVPHLGGGPVPLKYQTRADPSDPAGFSWVENSNVAAKSINELQVQGFSFFRQYPEDEKNFRMEDDSPDEEEAMQEKKPSDKGKHLQANTHSWSSGQGQTLPTLLNQRASAPGRAFEADLPIC